jgi:large subunit ribosomal protein L19
LLLHSPRIEKIEVLRSGHVRRARLYFLRQRTGRAARLDEKLEHRGEALADATVPAVKKAAPLTAAPAQS